MRYIAIPDTFVRERHTVSYAVSLADFGVIRAESKVSTGVTTTALHAPVEPATVPDMVPSMGSGEGSQEGSGEMSTGNSESEMLSGGFAEGDADVLGAVVTSNVDMTLPGVAYME